MNRQFQDKKIAIICDWINDWGWAEVVLEQLLEAFPNADIFTSVFWQQENPIFEWRKITTSFIQKIPFLNKSHKLALMLRPLAFESFDLSEYDVVISSTSAESKWVITKPDCLQICYCHTPTRYFWSHFHEYMNMLEFGILNPIGKWLMPKMVHKLRIWDFCASKRPDEFIANSYNTAGRIRKYYKREAEVIHPCIDTSKFNISEKSWDYYFYIGRCIPYKKFDLLIDSFNKNGKKLIIATNTDNKLYRELKNKSKENIQWKFNASRNDIQKYFSEAKAFIFPPEEDFGLVPVEAMASWTPVIAYGKWWALETVISEKTGIFFEKQTVESVNHAIEIFEWKKFDKMVIREHAEKFDKNVFKEKLYNFIENKLKY